MVNGIVGKQANSALSKICLVLGLIFCVWHILSSYYYVIGDTVEGFPGSLLSTQRHALTTDLNQKIVSLHSSLEYQVWPDQRAKNYKLLRKALRDKINLQPYSASDWLMLNAVGLAEELETANTRWVMANALTSETTTETKCGLPYKMHVKKVNGIRNGAVFII